MFFCAACKVVKKTELVFSKFFRLEKFEHVCVSFPSLQKGELVFVVVWNKIGIVSEVFLYITTLLSGNNHPPFDRWYFFSKSMKEAWFCYEKVSNVSVVMSQNDSEPFRPISATPGRFSIFFCHFKKSIFSVLYFWSHSA